MPRIRATSGEFAIFPYLFVHGVEKALCEGTGNDLARSADSSIS